MRTPIPTPVFDTYWRFAAARQAAFFARIERPGCGPWTEDPILRWYKFTNAYRAADRVSQFCIRNVIYGGPQTPEDVFFRTLLFKVFNSIETWQLLERELGAPVTWADYDFRRYNQILDRAMARRVTIFSAAYIMAPVPDAPRKHTGYLQILEQMMADRLPLRLAQSARSLEDIYQGLAAYPLMGPFVAFQYTIDLNYSSVFAFDEDDFVVAGPGAISGISKCFSDTGGLSPADLIRWVTERQEVEFTRLGLDFQSLWGRPLKLIDCQNLFCETNKYARVAHPEVIGKDGRTKIKQTFRPSAGVPIPYWFPPKWGINDRIPAAAAASPVLPAQGTLF